MRGAAARSASVATHLLAGGGARGVEARAASGAAASSSAGADSGGATAARWLLRSARVALAAGTLYVAHDFGGEAALYWLCKRCGSAQPRR
jgi:hypothetical protein